MGKISNLIKGRAIVITVLAGIMLSLPLYFLVSRADTSSPPPPSSQKVPDFDHVIIIVEENTSAKRIVGNPSASYINSLINQYSYANQYYATDHPSLPNYLRMTSGTNAGVVDDCAPSDGMCSANVKNLMDEIEKSGRTWKAYMEDMPEPCTPNSTGLYDNEHNPFVYYTDILNNKTRCEQHVVPYSQLYADLDSGNLPNYVFISPNLCNDMHSCGIQTGDEWLSKNITKILDSSTFSDSLSAIFITWDESKPPDVNNVPMIIVGPHVKNNYVSQNRYDHVSLLRTIESAWDLPALNSADSSAKTMNEFFK